MNKLRKQFTISQLVTGGPILLLLLLSLVLGVSRYSAEYQSEINHALTEARIGAQPILNLMNASVGGGNYANVQAESALQLYRASKQLEFFSVQGTTDLNNEAYGIVYDSHVDHVIRTAYATDYDSSLTSKIERSQAALAKLPTAHRKRAIIEKMLDDQEAAYALYQRDQEMFRDLRQEYQQPTAAQLKDGYYLDEVNWKLHLVIATENSGGGELWMVLDASSLGALGGKILKSVLPVNLVALLVSVVLAFLLSRVITTPINNMVKRIEAIESDSDLSQRLDDRGKDEVAQVSGSLNQMLSKFQDILGEVVEASGRVNEASRMMSGVIGETTDGMERQRGEATQLSAAANQMLAAVADVASNASLAAQSASDANSQAVMGQEEVRATIASISELAEDVAKATLAMDKLNEGTDRIGAVVDVINGIAEQTNLLALNAAIEAARAGDQGRGFAVVADEVRNLAQRTQESTTEITAMISNLQNEAESVSCSMKMGSDRSLDCVKQAEQAGSALQKITEAVDQISSMNDQIASAAEQQSAVTDEINKYITNISDISELNGERVQGCSRTSEQLEGLAKALQSSVSRFKI